MDIEKMLSHTAEIVNKHEELEKKTGERFNLFSILDRERKEVTTHSRFLAELLSPKGSHGQESKFLELFIEQLGNEQLKDFDCSAAEVIAEKNIGSEEINNSKGLPYSGQIDTFIKDRNGNCIVIENKVDAGDQPKQLVRYHRFLHYPNNSFRTKTLYYLAQTEKEPNIASINDGEITLVKDKDYICISYKNLITSWLEKCIEHSSNIPNVKETIGQYLRIVKKITRQLNSGAMKEIIEKITKENLKKANEIFEATKAIEQSYDIAIQEVSNELKNSVISKLETYYPNLNIKSHENRKGSEKSELSFSSIHINNLPLENFIGTIIIESFNTKGLHFGGELFIGKFTGEKPEYYKDVKSILKKEDLLANLDNYGRNENRETIVNTIVDAITTYIDERKL